MAATEQLTQSFERVEPLTVGLEEEVMLLDPGTLQLSAVAERVLSRLGDDVRFTAELPASQLEIRTAPAGSAVEAGRALGEARKQLAAACGDDVLPAAAGVHPFSPAEGELNHASKYDYLHGYYRWAAPRQLVSSLQVHVAVGGAERTLAVYNALRGFLPEIAALAANAPIYEGVDTGLASIRPLICGMLPRQGVPPALRSWEQFAEELSWGMQGAGFPNQSSWWWELRPHPGFGTLEVRVPDAQTRLPDAGAVAGFVQALVATIVDRYEAGEPLPAAPRWRIEENRWAALRFGVDGQFVSLRAGRRMSIRERLLELIEHVTPAAERLGLGGLLESIVALAEANGAVRQREIFGSAGAAGVAQWLAASFDGEPES